MSSPADLCHNCFQPNTSALVAHWSFNGTSDDISPTQLGKALIVNNNTSLDFEDSSPVESLKTGFMKVRVPGFLNVPAVAFLSDASFTMSWDMRLPAAPTARMVLLSNWTQNMWQFMTFLDPDRRVGCTLRRNQSGGGSDPDPGLVDVMTSSPIPVGQWVSIAFSFDRSNRTFYVYVNGKKSGSSVVRPSITNLSLNPSNAPKFQFGMQADAAVAQGTMDADIRNLRVLRLFSHPI